MLCLSVVVGRGCHCAYCYEQYGDNLLGSAHCSSFLYLMYNEKMN